LIVVVLPIIETSANGSSSSESSSLDFDVISLQIFEKKAKI
jgi:hypothetical protein